MICNMLQWSVSPLHFQCWQSGLKIATIFRSKGHLKPPHTLGWMWMWLKMKEPPDSLTKWFLFVGNYQFQRHRLIFKTCLYWKKHPRPKIDSPNWENESAHSAGLVPAVLHGFQDGLHRWFQFQWHFIAWNFGWVNSIHDAQGETISRSSPSLKMRNFWEKLGVQVISFRGTNVTMATGGSQFFPKLKRKIEEKN